jgi:hypothetical protein
VQLHVERKCPSCIYLHTLALVSLQHTKELQIKIVEQPHSREKLASWLTFISVVIIVKIIIVLLTNWLPYSSLICSSSLLKIVLKVRHPGAGAA